MTTSRGRKEAFSKFFEEPTRDKLRTLLRDHSGENDFLDFKEEWPKETKLAKHVLAFANLGNGCIVVGIAEADDGTLDPVGLAAMTDKANIINGIKGYLPPDLPSRIFIDDFHFEASEYPKLVGKKFQVMLVEYSAEHVPSVSVREGEGIKAPAIYVRRGAQSVEANHDEVQKIINKRIETKYSTTDEITLKQHFEQLRVLYAERPRINPLFANMFRAFGSLGQSAMGTEDETDTFKDFVERTISMKKSIILKSIGATPDMLEAEALLRRLNKPTDVRADR